MQAASKISSPMCRLSRTVVRSFLGIFAFAIWLAPASAQQLSKRLVLKDGSYQLITKYEVKGDRVHYFSAERNEWEELPNSLVDWNATAQFEKDRAAGSPVPEAVQLDREQAAERQAEESKSPEVAPRLRLPDDGTVYLLDTFRAEPELVELQQDNAQVNRDTKRNVIRAAINPIASSKQPIELQGAHSSIQAHATLPSIYIKIPREPQIPAPKNDPSSQSRNDSWERFRIVHLQSKQDKRIVGNIKVAVYGKVTQQQDFVPAKLEQLSGGWAKMTPASELQPGEYALVEVLEKNELSASMWDFGVNPSAPANGMTIKPSAAKAPAAPKELQQRKPN